MEKSSSCAIENTNVFMNWLVAKNVVSKFHKWFWHGTMDPLLLSKVDKQNLHVKISVAVDAEKRELTNLQSFRGISFEESFKMPNVFCKKVSIYCVCELS